MLHSEDFRDSYLTTPGEIGPAASVRCTGVTARSRAPSHYKYVATPTWPRSATSSAV